MQVRFYSDERHYLDSGPSFKNCSKLTLFRDVLRDAYGKERARFLLNSWGTTVGLREEVYDTIEIEDDMPGGEFRETDYRKNPCYRAALHYLSLGWCPVALCPPDHFGVSVEHKRICKRPGKVPADCYWKKWQKTRPTKKDIDEQWERQPNANVGVVTGGVSGLVGVDIDGDVGGAFQSFAWLRLPDTLTFRTGRGTRFLYDARAGGEFPPSCVFKQDENSLEILAEGRYTVMPPSRHPCGKIYTWEHRDPGSIARFKTKLPGKHDESLFDSNPDGTTIPSGLRNQTLFRAGSALRRFGAGQDEIFSALKFMNTRCDPPLDNDEIETISRQAAKYQSILSQKK